MDIACSNMCGLLVLLAVACLLPPSSYATNNTTDSLDSCNSNISAIACADKCFSVIPPDNIYLSEGDGGIEISVVPVSEFGSFFYTSFKDGNALTSNEQRDLACESSNNCIFDDDSPSLEITSFNPSVSAGPYSFQITGFENSIICSFPFNLIEADPPTLTKEDNPTTILNEDGGPLVLSPTVFHGTPPGVVEWYKDGVNISKGDEYRKDTVGAEDRGRYMAKIEHQTGAVELVYDFRVNFRPIIEITTSPPDTNPAVVNEAITITCRAISYPKVADITLTSSNGLPDSTTIKSLEEDGFHFEAEAVSTTAGGCPSLTFTCTVGNGVFTSSKDLLICQKAPNVTSLSFNRQQSTNTSAQLTWSLDPQDSSVSNYQVQYRQSGGPSFTTLQASVPVTSKSYTVEGLSPGTEYEFRVSAVDNSESTDDHFSPSIFFTTFTRPLNAPTGLMANRNETAVTLKWNQPSSVPLHAPISKYHVIFYTSTNPTRMIVPLEASKTSYSLPNDKTLSYTFSLRATNNWGSSDLSGQVEARADSGDTTPLDITVVLTVTIDNNAAVLNWEIESLTTRITKLEVLISRIEPLSASEVDVSLVLTHNVTDLDLTESCFSNLNSTDTYQFCIQPYTESGLEVPIKCEFGRATGDSSDITNSRACVSVQPERVTSEPVIPSWGIAVMVVGVVGLVFLFFCGCGLYFGLKKNRKGEVDYEGQNETFDKINSSNGNYPYPPPPPRSASPSRNCISYRHNNHGHHLDWQGVTAV